MSFRNKKKVSSQLDDSGLTNFSPGNPEYSEGSSNFPPRYGTSSGMDSRGTNRGHPLSENVEHSEVSSNFLPGYETSSNMNARDKRKSPQQINDISELFKIPTGHAYHSGGHYPSRLGLGAPLVGDNLPPKPKFGRPVFEQEPAFTPRKKTAGENRAHKLQIPDTHNPGGPSLSSRNSYVRERTPADDALDIFHHYNNNIFKTEERSAADEAYEIFQNIHGPLDQTSPKKKPSKALNAYMSYNENYRNKSPKSK